jgi:hypothetical protein
METKKKKLNRRFRLFSLFFACLHSVTYAYVHVYGFRLFSLFFVCLHSVSYTYAYGLTQNGDKEKKLNRRNPYT